VSARDRGQAAPVVSPGKNKVPLHAVRPPKRLFLKPFSAANVKPHMRRDDVNRSGGNGGFRRIELASRSGEAGEFSRRLCDPLPVGAFHGSNSTASHLAVAGQAVRMGRPPNSSAPDLPSDFHFESCALQNRERRIRSDYHRDFSMIPEYPVLDCVHDYVHMS
jgi:hypothetical protein